MRTLETISALRAYLRGIREEEKSVGFVPTMGALHEGHLSLIRRAKADCDVTVVSIFVNPLQFGPNEDFTSYPRDLARDQRLTSQEEVDALFLPKAEELYPAGFQTFVEVPQLSATLEGAHRPGHFRGVATVVTKLLNLVQPDRVYFGQKDYQQLLIIEQLARDLNLQVQIVPVATHREPDGLAMSSRNARLSPEERRAATVLYRALRHAEQAIGADADDPETLRSEMEALIAAEPRAKIDYVALVHPETLEPVTTLAGQVTLAALAVRIGQTRLIDNHLLAPEGVPFPRHRQKSVL
jgi:pantoate--beta-alanine ligase